MAKWSKQTLRKVRSYRAYKARLKKYGRETGQSFKAVPYSVYSEKYNERLKQVESGERKTFGSVGAELIRKENRPEVLYNEYKNFREYDRGDIVFLAMNAVSEFIDYDELSNDYMSKYKY